MNLLTNYKTKQDLRKYNKESKEVWKTLYNRQVNNLLENKMAVSEFWNGLGRLKIIDEIPKISNLNKLLKENNSVFKLVPVTGIIPDDLFFSMLKKAQFPTTVWLRDKESIDYIEEPDMFHDIFGHVPFLINPSYCHFLMKIGEYGEKIFKSNLEKERQYKMSRLYWYTIEFGLIRQKRHEFKIFGSGILSSYEESKKALSENSEKLNFTTTNDLLSRRFEKNDLQPFYAYIDKNIKFLNKININNI